MTSRIQCTRCCQSIYVYNLCTDPLSNIQTLTHSFSDIYYDSLLCVVLIETGVESAVMVVRMGWSEGWEWAEKPHPLQLSGSETNKFTHILYIEKERKCVCVN